MRKTVKPLTLALILGTGGVGTGWSPVRAEPGGPNSCLACHSRIPPQTVREIKSCWIACHDQEDGGFLIPGDADWLHSRVKVETLIEAAKLRIDQDRREGKDTAAEKGLAEAEGNFQIADAGRGVHHFDYAMDLFQAAEERLNRIWGPPAGTDAKDS